MLGQVPQTITELGNTYRYVGLNPSDEILNSGEGDQVRSTPIVVDVPKMVTPWPWLPWYKVRRGVPHMAIAIRDLEEHNENGTLRWFKGWDLAFHNSGAEPITDDDRKDNYWYVKQ